MNSAFKVWLWRWTLRQARVIVWAVDEWVHAQELKLRESAATPAAAPVEFNRKASAARERVHKAKHAGRAARPRLAHLNYHAGAWVRSE